MAMLLHGLMGDDTLFGGRGDDILDGGRGNDGYVYQAGDGVDIILSTPRRGRFRCAADQRIRSADVRVYQSGDLSDALLGLQTAAG